MATALHKATDARGSIASVEGYLALAFIILPFLAPKVDHPSNDMIVGEAIWIGIAFGLAIGGARFGRGGGRFAGRIALGILSLWLLVVLVVSIVRWQQVLWYWRR